MWGCALNIYLFPTDNKKAEKKKVKMKKGMAISSQRGKAKDEDVAQLVH